MLQARKNAPDVVEVALSREELDMDTVTMAAKYEARVREQEMVQKEDFSDMVAEHAAKQKVRLRLEYFVFCKASLRFRAQCKIINSRL